MKPLLYSLFLWLVLLAIPATHGQTLLDWKSATLQRLSATYPEWSPLDAPYEPDKDMAQVLNPDVSLTPDPDDLHGDVNVNDLTIAPQFESMARGSSDRDVLVWCARSATDPQAVTQNWLALSHRFPNDAALLAWTCSAQLDSLNLTTRVPGPLTSGNLNWSVQSPNPPPVFPSAPSPPGVLSPPPSMVTPGFEIERGQGARWDALAVQARQGQKLEPHNGLWWWLEAACLLGARRDAQVWPVLHAGGAKPFYDDHFQEIAATVRRAHFKTVGAIPIMTQGLIAFDFASRWREVARQVAENAIGERFEGHHNRALTGGLDVMHMGRMLRSSPSEFADYSGVTIERIALQSALPRSVGATTRFPRNASVQVLAGHPRSLLRYANEQQRADIARQISQEWPAMLQAQKASMARIVAPTSSLIEGVDDSAIASAAGFQNTGNLLVQTLPIPLIALALLSLLSLRFRRFGEPFPLPSWTRGLGWSAFALLTLIGAQTLLTEMVWGTIGVTSTKTPPWSFDFMMPRLLTLLPVWAFAFVACVMAVGALWATMFAARRARGDASLVQRLRLLFSSPDDHVGVVNLEPLMQIIALLGAWGITIVLLGLWFYLPQKDAHLDPTAETFHRLYAGPALTLFCIVAIYLASLFRTGKMGFRAYFRAWLPVARRFLVAHIALTTTLYVLLSIGTTYWGARFDAQWIKANAVYTPTKP